MTEGRDPGNSKKPLLPRQTVVWLFLALMSTGAIVGWLVGLSESPLGAVVLPLLFAVVAGAGGFHFAGGKLNSDVAKQLLLHSAQATVVFMISCAAGVHFGVTLRTGEAPPGPADDNALAGPEQVSKLSVPEIVRLGALEKKLHLVGMSRESVRVFVTKYVEDCIKGEDTRRIAGRPTARDFDELEAALETVSTELGKLDPEDKLPNAYKNLQENLPKYLGHLKNLKRLVEATESDVPKGHYKDFLQNIDEDLSELIRDKEAPKLSRRDPPLNFAPFYGLALIVDVQKEPLENGWRSTSGVLDSDDVELLDNTIKLMVGRAEPEYSKSPRPGYGIEL